MNTVDVTIDPGEIGAPDPQRLSDFTVRVLDALSIDAWEVSLLFCSNERIRQLNREFRQLDEPTDVLSFPQFEQTESDVDRPANADGRVYAGDIVISIDYAQSNAQEFSVSLEEELKRLIVHGLLHLHGLDHSDNDASQPMLRKQESLLSHLAQERLF